MEFADEGFSCDDDEVYTKNQSTESSKPSSLQDLYITEHLTSEPCQENNVPLFNPEEDLMDLVATEETRIETGSQVAKSIISSIFHRIEHKGKRRETEVELPSTCEEVEVLNDSICSEPVIAEGQSEVRSSTPSSSPVNPKYTYQTPRTVARISDWINDLQSNYSIDVSNKSLNESKTKIESLSSTQLSDDLDGSVYDSEDDQPSGYTYYLVDPADTSMIANCQGTPDRPRYWIRNSRHNNSSLNSKRSRPSLKKTVETMENIFDQGELGSAEGTNFDENSSLRILDGSGGSGENQLAEHVKEEYPRAKNHYLKIVERTSQVLKRDEDGGQSLDTVHSVERTFKDLDKSSFSFKTCIVILVLLILLMGLLHYFNLVPAVDYTCILRMKNITNQPDGTVLQNIMKQEI